MFLVLDCVYKMDLWKIQQVIVLISVLGFATDVVCEDGVGKVGKTEITTSWQRHPDSATWSLEARIPMTPEFDPLEVEGRGKKKRLRKKLEKFLLPLLLAYKLKFFTLIPVLIGGLLLLTGATGLAGFFFALFAAVMGLKSHHDH
ncbi:uncharacterized protein LOC123314343 [Coccinella septempunctata]|uniref:uncharacterized protein LOC123314343 n=1 Tax=Coccinella septempunctata TaxID=41139 RepID=UPI001D079A00|nr:uncharacterized protein LOC123314343 [Coccinella septempunctata]